MEFTTAEQAQVDRMELRLEEIEAMLEIMLERVPNGQLGWSRSEQCVWLRVIKNRERRAEHAAHLEKQQEADAAWKIPAARRESLLLHVLGGERLTLREMTARLNGELGYPSPENRNRAVYERQVRSLVRRMVREGQLERAEETYKNKPRNRYFRKRPLEGPIVELRTDEGHHAAWMTGRVLAIPPMVKLLALILMAATISSIPGEAE